MAKPFVISIPHSLGKQEATRRLQAGLDRTVDIPLLKLEEQAWSGDRLTFRAAALGQIATGNVDVGDDTVRLELVLPPLLQKFGAAVQNALTDKTRKLLDKKKT